MRRLLAPHSTTSRDMRRTIPLSGICPRITCGTRTPHLPFYALNRALGSISLACRAASGCILERGSYRQVREHSELHSLHRWNAIHLPRIPFGCIFLPPTLRASPHPATLTTYT